MKTSNEIVKGRTFLFLMILALIQLQLANSQTFQDKPSNEPDSDFPSKWDLIKGSAEIRSFDGEKVIYLANKGIITPKLDSKNYLTNTFTLQFDAYFDEVEKAITYQYYQIRFWDGNDVGIETTSAGVSKMFPLKISRHGAELQQRIPNEPHGL